MSLNLVQDCVDGIHWLQSSDNLSVLGFQFESLRGGWVLTWNITSEQIGGVWASVFRWDNCVWLVDVILFYFEWQGSPSILSVALCVEARNEQWACLYLSWPVLCAFVVRHVSLVGGGGAVSLSEHCEAFHWVISLWCLFIYILTHSLTHHSSLEWSVITEKNNMY